MTNTTHKYALLAFDSYFRGDQPDIPELNEIYGRNEEIELPD